MIRALWSAASGMGAQQLTVDVIANNISNVNTPGFKASRVEFQDVFYNYLRPPDDPDLLLQVGHGVMPSAITKHFTPGILEQTGQELDLAIEGNGFFLLRDGASNATEYTRTGNFRLDQQSRLVTADGRFLLTHTGVATVPGDSIELTVGPDGTLTSRSSTGEVRDLGRLQLATFPNATGLRAQGQNAYAATAASGAASNQWPGQNGVGLIRQGFIERSNVQLIEEIVGLMAAQRAYELSSKAIQSADEMMGLANNLRR